MACCLNQCWLIISEVLWHSPENNFTAIVQSIILYNKFENYTFKIIVTFPRGQWVEYLAVFGKGELQIDGSVQDCAVTLMHYQTSYCSLALSHWDESIRWFILLYHVYWQKSRFPLFSYPLFFDTVTCTWNSYIIHINFIGSTYQWLSTRLQYLQCISNGDTAVLL